MYRRKTFRRAPSLRALRNPVNYLPWASIFGGDHQATLDTEKWFQYALSSNDGPITVNQAGWMTIAAPWAPVSGGYTNEPMGNQPTMVRLLRTTGVIRIAGFNHAYPWLLQLSINPITPDPSSFDSVSVGIAQLYPTVDANTQAEARIQGGVIDYPKQQAVQQMAVRPRTGAWGAPIWKRSRLMMPRIAYSDGSNQVNGCGATFYVSINHRGEVMNGNTKQYCLNVTGRSTIGGGYAQGINLNHNLKTSYVV